MSNRLFAHCFHGRRVLVTGHTGFKGSWLCSWLLQLGAEVAGYSLDVPTQPSHFEALKLGERLVHYPGDVRDGQRLAACFAQFKPEIVFHLAAQALVRRSYADPVLTFTTNAVGTLNLLECVRHQPGVQVVVLITSDKSYRNLEWTWGYRENDLLGGEDPYSASKACAENIIFSYFHSFLAKGEVRMATTRAGNVIGGGDWAADRIVPDCVRAWSEKQTVVLRSPWATRPWQHVLEPLSGYLSLAMHLWQKKAGVNGEAYNFGPQATVNQTVLELIEALSLDWPQAVWEVDAQGAQGHKESTLLKLNCDKALHQLGWQPVLTFAESVRFTSRWYRDFYDQSRDGDPWEYTQQQIQDYIELARARQLHWTRS